MMEQAEEERQISEEILPKYSPAGPDKFRQADTGRKESLTQGSKPNGMSAAGTTCGARGGSCRTS